MSAPTRAARRSAVWPWALAGLGLTLVGLVVAFFVGGDRPQTSDAGIPEASLFVEWALPITRSIVDLLAAATVGLLLAAAALLPSPKDLLASAPARAARLASWLAWAGAALALVVAHGVDLALELDEARLELEQRGELGIHG